MAGVQEKLYPPVIGASIPAFYNNNGTVVITVPFSMSRAVSASSVYSFSLKIKTAQSNSYITTLYSDANSTESFIGERIVKFNWPNFNEGNTAYNTIKIGQYLKVQLAYNTAPQTNGDYPTPGYFSTVAIVKFTSMPNIYIENMSAINDLNGIPIFQHTYTGVYQVTQDKNERPYSYNFYLYDNTKNLIEESGWQLHNTSVNTIATESLQLSTTTDTYTFNSTLTNNEEYYVQYGVRTINNLEVYSPMYTCIESSEEQVDLNTRLIAENVFEEGYVELRLERRDNSSESINIPISIEISRAEVGYADLYDLSDFNWQALRKYYFARGTTYTDIEQMRFKDYTVEQGVRYLYCFRQYNNNGVSSSRVISNLIEADFEDMFLYDGELQVKIRYNPKVSSFKVTRQEQKIDTIGSKFPFMFRNGIVEYKEFPIGGLISYLADNHKEFFKDSDDLNIIRADEAHRYQRTPIKEVNYVEVEVDGENYQPGLYHIQNNGKYVLANKLSFEEYAEEGEEEGEVIYPTFYERRVTYQDTSYETTQTLDSIGYNMRAERRFKLKLLNWLGDGKIKLFRSPAEGNYLVRLMNISLTPEDKVGRMIHNFQATAYEVEELNYKNLVELGFINIDEYDKVKYGTRSIRIMDIVRAMDNPAVSKRLNAETIVNMLSIQPATNTESTSFFVRIGTDNVEKRALIRTGNFNVNAPGELPDIWINLEDNKDLSTDLTNAFLVTEPVTNTQLEAFTPVFREKFIGNNNVTKNDLIFAAAEDIVGDAIITYTYYIVKVEVGDISNISNVYIKNEVGSLIGPGEISAYHQSSGGSQESEIIQFYVLNFSKKGINNIFIYNNTYYNNAAHTQVISKFEQNALYRLFTNSTDPSDRYDNKLYYSRNGTTLNASIDEDDDVPKRIVVNIRSADGMPQTVTFMDVPQLDLRNNYFNSISVGARYQLDYAYQEKITERVVT